MHSHQTAEEPGLFDTASDSTATPDQRKTEHPAHRPQKHPQEHLQSSASDRAAVTAEQRTEHLEAEIAELKALVESMAASRGKSSRRGTSAPADRDGHIFSAKDGQVKNQAADQLSRAVRGRAAGVPDDAPASGDAHATSPASSPAHPRGGVPVHDGSASGDSPARRHAQALVDEQDDASSTKQPPSPSTAEGLPGVGGGEAELRKDSMMAHLLDSLDAGEDIGHYGRLVFAMVARHFLPHDEVLTWLLKDEDLGEEEGRQMLLQVEQRDYSPPRRDRILTWQAEQSFPILPNVDDPDCGNLYRTLNFPQAIYKHIGHYREQKAEAGE